MSNYRRQHLPGGTCFFTVNLLERRGRLLVEHVGLLRSSFKEAMRFRPFEIIAIVILPDRKRGQVHLIDVFGLFLQPTP